MSWERFCGRLRSKQPWECAPELRGTEAELACSANGRIVIRCFRNGGVSGYGGVIRRIGTGDEPEPPTTGFAPFGVALQPAIFRT
jgi:hypothetical protein